MVSPSGRLTSVFKARLSITVILTLSMVLVIAVVMALTTVMDVHRERTLFREQLEERALLLADTLNETLADPLYFLDVDEIRDTVSVMQMGITDLEYIQVFRPDGSLLVDTRGRDDPGALLSGEYALRAIQSQQVILETHGDALEVTAPIVVGPQVLGAVHFDFNTQSLASKISGIIWQHVWQGIALIALGAVVAYLIAGYVTNPLKTLAAAASRIGSGDLDTRVSITGTAETVILGKALVKMSVELKRLYQGLEEQVEERTGELSRANEALEEQVAERTRVEKRVRASLQEKEVLLREINHRVKNNLQIVSSMLSLQSRNIHDEQALGVFQESQDRIKAMALIHEKLYQSEDLARIDFGEYVQSLVGDLSTSYQIRPDEIEMKIEVDQTFLGIDTAIPCGLIINELVSNSLKHAFPEGRRGKININIRSAGQEHTIAVCDDGVGFPRDIDIEHTETLGLRLVKALTDQLGGTLDLDSSSGTTVVVAFPEKEVNNG